MKHEKIRAVIVDDERLARKRIRRLLTPEADIEVLGECAGGREAVEFLARHEADLLFLDVQMPRLDGFGVLDALPPGRLPVVVFVTAYDEYAIRAFQVHAFDYILKPFDRARFTEALERARTQLGYLRGGRQADGLSALLDEVRARRKPTRFPIKTADRVLFVNVDDIDRVQAADNYVCLHAGKESYLLRETMNSIESRLDPDRFVRIHRSTIVNTERIKELRPWFHGEYVVLLTNGTELTLSRSYRDRLLGLLAK